MSRILPSKKRQTDIDALCKSRDRWLVTFFIGALAGIICGTAGLIIGGLFLFGFFATNQMLDRVETWMLVLSFPLLLLSAHCLDKIAESKKVIRFLNCEEQK